MTVSPASEPRSIGQRLFGAIDSADESRIVIREMSIALLLISALLVSLVPKAGLIAPASGVIIAVPSALLLATRLRSTSIAVLLAVILVSTGLLVLGAIRGGWVLLFWVLALELAGRANRAAFKLHAFERELATPERGIGS